MVSMAHLALCSGLIGVMALAGMLGMARMVGLTGTVWPLTLPPSTLPPLAYLPYLFRASFDARLRAATAAKLEIPEPRPAQKSWQHPKDFPGGPPP